MTAEVEADTSTDVLTSDVCIVGAGLAGMNALFVASKYLRPGQRVILVDRRQRVGGMWVDTYPYVRLHQPHAMFTAGNIGWTLGRERGYLATKDEVLAHFEHCLQVIRRRVTVDELFGWEVESHEEADGTVRVVCTSRDGGRRVIETKRLIKAYGFAISPNPPLEISSTRVRSVSPDSFDLTGAQMRSTDTPVWVIGGGKTAMDTAHALIKTYPGREVNLVAGSGMFFLNRDRSFPVGARRWWAGTLPGSSGAQMLRRFDGYNEKQAAAWVRTTYGIAPIPDADDYLLGILSEAESRAICAGLNDTIVDRFVDVVDRNDSAEMRLGSGAVTPVQPGSWIVNCTGYLLRNEQPYEPYISASGAVLSIQTRSATMHLTSLMAYFLTHMLFLNKLTSTPLYEIDAQDLATKSKTALPFGILLVAQYNLSLLYEKLPSRVFLECGTDANRWYPFVRRLYGSAQFVLTHRRDRERARRKLEILSERFDVRCGPLASAATAR